MLLKELPELPQDEVGLQDILFPNENGRLPVTKVTYSIFEVRHPEIVDKLLFRADGSELCVAVSHDLFKQFLVRSEMDVSVFVGGAIKDLFALLDSVSLHSFKNEVLLNQRENSRSSSSRTGSTGKMTRLDTLVIASDYTFLVGEDKALKLVDAEVDLKVKLRPLSPVFYRPVMFMLDYMATGTDFQWVYLSNDKELKPIPPILNLSSFEGRSRFLLRVGYAYKLIKKMADSVPTLPGRRAMFTLEAEGDRILDWAHDSVLKIIKSFSRHCEIFQGTSLKVIQEAYNVAKGCKFLARARREPKLTVNTYSVRIAPLGCEVKLVSEQDGKKFAHNVCTTLAALHGNGIVHRDVRLPNIVKVFESQTEYYFMVIDLETMAKADFELPIGLHCFDSWTSQTLEGEHYTPRSDMYHLGMVLKRAMKDSAKSLEKLFMSDLISKQLDAEMALNHTWLSDEVL